MTMDEILKYVDAAATPMLALVAWHLNAFRGVLDSLKTEIVKLVTGDVESRTKQALDVGQVLGRIDAQLGELVKDSRESRAASGSDTRHKPADRRDYPSDRH